MVPLLFQVVKSVLLQVILIVLTKSVPHIPVIVPVIMIAPVAHHASPVITKLLGLLVVNHVG